MAHGKLRNQVCLISPRKPASADDMGVVSELSHYGKQGVSGVRNFSFIFW